MTVLSKTLSSPEEHRLLWFTTLCQVADPVLKVFASGKLKEVFPWPAEANREQPAELEMVARLLAGISPWLACEEKDLPTNEREVHAKYVGMVQEGLAAAFDPDSPAYLGAIKHNQVLVEAAFLALAIMQGRAALWDGLSSKTQQQVIDFFKGCRVIEPGFNNWLLFAAVVEACLKVLGVADWDRMRIDYALRQHEQWYVGDGLYTDGPRHHHDYYNSFVIHPLLLSTIHATTGDDLSVEQPYPHLDTRHRGANVLLDRVLPRAQRYAEVLERMIAPDGTYPIIGRSMAYRFGCFHLLSHLALHQQLPDSLPPAQVRSALSAVIRRTVGSVTDIPTSPIFDANGFLEIGLVNQQPALGEHYINPGSCYLMSFILQPLGMRLTDAFWANSTTQFTSQRLWAGGDLPADQAMREAGLGF